MKKKKTPKTTMVMDVQITIVYNDEIEKPDKEGLAKEIKQMIGADDVVVKNAKVFINN